MDEAFALEQLEKIKPEIIIGVDSGLSFLYHHQVMPTRIVGDFDSVPPEVIHYYRTETKVPIQEFLPEKDDTDTEIALRLAIDMGVSRLWILGATGTRLDHVLANIQILTIAQEAGVFAYLVDRWNRISLIEKEATLTRETAFGPYFSFFPLGGSIPGFSIQGAKYPLKDYFLSPYESRCVSNEFLEDEVRITFPQGKVILMETRD